MGLVGVFKVVQCMNSVCVFYGFVTHHWVFRVLGNVGFHLQWFFCSFGSPETLLLCAVGVHSWSGGPDHFHF